MKKIILVIFATLLFGVFLNAQTNSNNQPAPSDKEATPKKKIFRANKTQVIEAQKKLKVAESGKLDTETRAAIKTFQGENGLRKTGTLNRATLEKMNIELTAAQKEIPVSPNSFASADSTSETKKPAFRATKDQITQAQQKLKDKGTYTGAADGKYNDDFRTVIKKFQDENGLDQTGTLNRVTLEKMGIALTDKQNGIETPPASSSKSDTDKPKRGAVFRANKEQIMLVQKMLKEKTMYDGEQTGKLDDPTREGIKKWQTANGVKVTGTLNKETLEKMGIELTDKQKEN